MSQNDTRKDIIKFLEDKNLIVASNRGPVEFHIKNEEFEMKRGAGGLVSTLLPFMTTVNGTWVASAMTEGDRKIAGKHEKCIVPIPEENPEFCVSFVVVDEEIYSDYYSVISNPLLWFIQHYMWNTPYVPEIDDNIHKAWHDSYVCVNKLFAEKIIEEAQNNDKKPLIMLQDYHLYTCPGYIREKFEDVFLSQFIHIPWPQSEYFSILPEYMQEAIIKGLLSNNHIGFHIKRYMKNFLMICQKYADEVDFKKNIVHYEGREILVKNYPISVDTARLNELARSDEVLKHEQYLKKLKGNNFLIYRTERTDPSKNIVRGFKAYELFLQKHPEFQGEVTFFVTGMSTRENVKEYKDYKVKVNDIISEINDKYSNDGWKPIVPHFNAEYSLVTAALKNYDILMVNSIHDGMNIVPKEGSILNENNGVLIISKTTGAYDELKEYSININALDISQTAEAIYKAITMKQEEREKRLRGLKEIIRQYDVYNWMGEQFKDIQKLF